VSRRKVKVTFPWRRRGIWERKISPYISLLQIYWIIKYLFESPLLEWHFCWYVLNNICQIPDFELLTVVTWEMQNTGLFKIIVGVLRNFHIQYTWDSSICIFLFNRITLLVFVTYLTSALYVRNCRWKIVNDRHSWNVSTQNVFSLPFASILVSCAPSGEMHNYCTPHIKENFENFLIHRCNYILLSQVYCVWQVVQTPTVISNNPVFLGCDIVTCSVGIDDSEKNSAWKLKVARFSENGDIRTEVNIKFTAVW
jgi:hypothetical protein